MGFGDVATTNVIEPAVIGFPHHGIDRAHLLIAWQGQGVVHQGIGGGEGAQGVGEHDGGFQIAQLLHLAVTHQLAETVADMNRGGQLALKEIAGLGNDGGHPGTDVLALDQRGMTHGDTGDIGNGIEDAGLQHTDADAVVRHPHFLGRGDLGQSEQQDERQGQGSGAGHDGESGKNQCGL